MNRSKCLSCSWCQPLSSTKQVSIFSILKYLVWLPAFCTGRKSGTVICFVPGAATASISLRGIQNRYFILSPEIVRLKELYGAEYCRKWEGFYFIKQRKLIHFPNDRLISEDQSLWVFSSAIDQVWAKECVQGVFFSADLKWAPLDLRKIKILFLS